MTEFTLHERLAADTIEVARLPLSLVLLMNARQWPWLILVPRRAGLCEIHDLDAQDQTMLMREVVRASRILASLVKPDKINIGALGNVVPQLHVHVVARYKTDLAWPRPIWGAAAPEPYAETELRSWLQRLQTAFKATDEPA